MKQVVRAMAQPWPQSHRTSRWSWLAIGDFLTPKDALQEGTIRCVYLCRPSYNILKYGTHFYTTHNVIHVVLDELCIQHFEPFFTSKFFFFIGTAKDDLICLTNSSSLITKEESSTTSSSAGTSQASFSDGSDPMSSAQSTLPADGALASNSEGPQTISNFSESYGPKLASVMTTSLTTARLSNITRVTIYEPTTTSTSLSSNFSNTTTAYVAQNAYLKATNTTSPVPIITSLPHSNSSMVNATCAITSYAADYPVGFGDGSDCAVQVAAITDGDYWYYTDRCLATYCSTSFESVVSAYTGPVSKVTTAFPWKDLSWLSNGALSLGPARTSTVTLTLKPSAIISRKAPCCGACYLTVQGLNLFYWPEQDASTSNKGVGTDIVRAIHAGFDTPASNVDENGFTFISPSVYIAITSVAAWDYCGPSILSTTMALDAEELSTLSPSTVPQTCPPGVFPFTSTTFTRRMTFPDLQQNCSTYAAYNWDSDWFFNWIDQDDPTPGSGPPSIPGPTSTRASDPTIEVESPPAWFLNPLSEPTPTSLIAIDPSYLPVEITVRPATKSNEPDDILTLRPTWIPGVPGHATSHDEGSIDDLPVLSSDEKSLAVIIRTQTLLPGYGVTAGGTTTTLADYQTAVSGGVYIFLDPQSALVIVNGTSTIPLSPIQPTLLPQAPPLVLKLDGKTYTEDVASHFIVETQTLIPGGNIVIGQTTTTSPDGQRTTVGGTTLYLDPHGTVVIVDGRTSFTLEPAQVTDTLRLTVVDGQTYTLPRSGAAIIVIGGTTHVLPDGRITVQGGRTSMIPGSTTRENNMEMMIASPIHSAQMRPPPTMTRITTSVEEQKGPSVLVDQSPAETNAQSASSGLYCGRTWKRLVAVFALFLGLVIGPF
ncbi:Nn.00g001160.m01.CDS01 [Neocucurbitaria sp. VM-36]